MKMKFKGVMIPYIDREVLFMVYEMKVWKNIERDYSSNILRFMILFSVGFPYLSLMAERL